MGEATQISAVLQAALFLASVAVIVLVACLIPFAFQARWQLQKLVLTAEQLKANLDGLVHDSGELVRNLDSLATRAGQQLDEVNQVVRTVHQWIQRADRLVNGVGAVIEPPVFSLSRKLSLFSVGASAFIRTLLRRNHHNPTHTQTSKENHRV